MDATYQDTEALYITNVISTVQQRGSVHGAILYVKGLDLSLPPDRIGGILDELVDKGYLNKEGVPSSAFGMYSLGDNKLPPIEIEL